MALRDTWHRALVYFGLAEDYEADVEDYYEPETSIWKMVTRVFRERELAYVRAAIEAFEGARKQLGKLKATVDADTKRRIRFIDGRLASLLTLSRIGEGLLLMLSSGQQVDPTPMKSLFHPEDES